MPNSRIFKNKYKYPNLLAFFSILALTYFLHRVGILDQMVHDLEDLGYFGIFLVGMVFVSAFTAAPAAVVLVLMLEKFSIPEIAFIAGLGSVLGDYIIFRFMEDGLVRELKEVFEKVGGHSIFRFHWIAQTKYFIWLGPVLGAILIASPFPDELGIGLLGIYKMSDRNFILLSWILDTVGIFVILSGVKAVI